MPDNKRPLSPHLSIYRPQISSVISILHRITGVALYVGLGLLVIFLAVVGYAPEKYSQFHDMMASPVGQIFLFGWTLAFYFHFFNGIRHLCWDMGKGLDIPSVNKTGWAVVILTLLSSIASWIVALHNTGVIRL